VQTVEKYTSVIFFHGVGDPKRHVSLGALLDHLDLFGQRQSETGLGTLRKFRYKTTARQTGEVENFIECWNIRSSGGKPYIARTIRLHEAYWAPETDASYGFLYIFWWFLRRIINSSKMLFSRWRKYPALRLSTLCYLSERAQKPPHLEELERIYRDFENWEGRAKFPKGRYSDFYKFVEERSPEDERDEYLLTLAVWWKAFQFYNLSMLLKTLVQLLLVPFLGYVWATAVKTAAGWDSASSQIQVYAIFVAIVIPAGSVYFWRTLRSHVIDVLTWTIDSERGQRAASRRRIIDYCRSLVRSVTADPNCENCVLVAHSLGSCIAVESVLREGDFAKATALDQGTNTIGDHWLKKIKEVFLVGSPIDRIFHFFQTDTTFSHRYNRLFEEQRLSLSLPPFWDVGYAGETRVTNFWSRFDPISSQVHTLRKSVSERSESIQNIEAVPLGLPWPIASHISYFSDSLVTEAIYRSIVSGRWKGRANVSKKATQVMRSLQNMTFPLPFVCVWSLAAPLLGWEKLLPLSVLAANVLLVLWASKQARSWHEDKAGKHLNRGP
jgi:hypothetical protein